MPPKKQKPTLAQAEALASLIQAALAGNLSDDTIIAHTRSRRNLKYQFGVDKVAAGLSAWRRENSAETLRSVDHAALYQQLVAGSLHDENGVAIKLANVDELNGAKKVTETCLKITARNPQGGVIAYLTAPDATRNAVAAVKFAPAEDLAPLIKAALAGNLSDDTIIAYARSQVNKVYQYGVDKVAAGLSAWRRENSAETLRSVDHAALYRELVAGSLHDENGVAIKLASANELRGAKKVTETCLKITARNLQGGVITYLTAPEATRKAVAAVKFGPAADLAPLIQAALVGNLSDDTVIAYTRSQVNPNYQPGVDKVAAGLSAWRRESPAATLKSADHAALYQQLVAGSLHDENGLTIQLANAGEFNGAKKVTETCLKITARNSQGDVITYLTAPEATRKAVAVVKFGPAADLAPLIQAALLGNLSDDTIIAYTRSQVNPKYQPGVDKVGAGLSAWRRENPAATLKNVDHADLYQQLVAGSLHDENGLTIKLANADEFNGAKKVTDTCVQITGRNPQGGVMTYLAAPDATREAVAALKLAPAANLAPLIQAALTGNLSDDTIIAYTRSQVCVKYQPGVDKVGAVLSASRRENPAATLKNVDHADLYQQLVAGSLHDENGLTIKLANADEFNGAKKVTDTCVQITGRNPQGGVMTYLTAPDATWEAVAAVKNPWFLSRKGKEKDRAPDLSVTRTNIEEISRGENDQAMYPEGFPLVELRQAMDASRSSRATSSFAQGSGSSMFDQPGMGTEGGQWDTSTSSALKRRADEQLSSHHSKFSRVEAASSSDLTAPYAALALPNELRPEDALSGVSDRQNYIRSLQSIVDLQGTEENRQTESYKSSYYEIKNTLLDPNNASIVSALEEDLRGQGKAELFELLQAMKERVTARGRISWPRSSWEITDAMAIEGSSDVPQSAPMMQGIQGYQARDSYPPPVASASRSRGDRYPLPPGQANQASPYQGR